MLTWLGVGNVEGLLVRADVLARPSRNAVLQRGGVVGYQLPPLRASVLAVGPGDTLIFATDGVRTRFADGLDLDRPPQEIALEVRPARTPSRTMTPWFWSRGSAHSLLESRSPWFRTVTSLPIRI